MESPKTKYLTVVGLLGILIGLAALYINPTASVSSLILAPVYKAFQPPQPASAIDSLAARYRKECPVHRFTSVKVISRNPHIMIIEDFLTSDEAQALINAAYFPLPFVLGTPLMSVIHCFLSQRSSIMKPIQLINPTAIHGPHI
jgi:hypothetical protein